jgi:hypothetical protein
MIYRQRDFNASLLGTFGYYLHGVLIYEARSGRPHVLADALDPRAQPVHVAVPLAQAQAHALDLLHVKDLWLDPVDASDLGDLVDGTAQQAEAEALHDEVLDVRALDVSSAADGVEGQGAVVRRAAEDSLGQGGQAELLGEEGLVAAQQRVAFGVCLQRAIRAQVAAVEGEQHVAQPDM